MDAFEEEQLRTNFEYPESHVLVGFLIPTNSAMETAKSLFCAIASEYDLRCSQYGDLRMQAEGTHPFSVSIRMKLQMHPTKGCMAVLRYKRKHITLLAVNSFLASPLPPSCEYKSWENCKEWWECRIHGETGLLAFFDSFFDKFKHAVINANISFTPLDNLPVCLQGTFLGVNYPQTGELSFQEKQMFYIDIPQSAIESDRQWVIEISSTKKVSLLLRYNEPPTLLSSDHSQSCSKYGNNFRVICIVDRLTTPKLRAGRWFVAVKGASLFFKSSFRISCKLQPYPSSGNLDDDDWVVVGDDSTPNGRKGKAQIIKGYSDIPVNIVSASYSQPIPVQRNPHGSLYSTSSSESDFALAGKFSEMHVAQIPRSVPSGFYSDTPSEDEEREVPKHFICPISCEIMQKPVIAADGHSYELSFIEKWLEDHIRSPMTGEEMPHKMLIANFNLKSQIDEWRSRPVSDTDFELLNL